MFRKLLDQGEAGDNVGLLLRGIDKKDVKRGMVVAKPGSITPHTEFEAEVYILKKEEGWPSHSVPPQIPSAVLPAYDGHHRRGRTARRC